MPSVLEVNSSLVWLDFLLLKVGKLCPQKQQTPTAEDCYSRYLDKGTGKEITKIFINYKQRHGKMSMNIQHLHLGCKIAGHSKVRSELVLKTKDLSSTTSFPMEMFESAS